ncbi:fimbrial protein [Rosenbergiella sp. S61]|uniref:Fimbrial protein n=1 Tax=Rosenbergiella gaditana TaxID=2726987 RepID=A0ABS5SVK9_9GAMM|nr:fimbrial protein [Rosenbergiella gaditana]MBT0724144.1 fimbrial protein [Rosenbergiella gaditana]
MKYLSVIKQLILAILVFPSLSYAYTCTSGAATTLSPPNITIQRDLPVGSQIGSDVTGAVVTAFTCSNTPSPSLTYQQFGGKGYGTYVATLNGRRIYSTNVAGIGYSVTVVSVNNCAGSVGYVDGTNNVDGNQNNRIMCTVNGLLGNQPIQGQMRITYYKTATTTGSGTVNGMTVASFILRNNQTSWQNPETLVNTASFNVTTLACTVTNTAISVPMGTVEKRSFSGVGTWPSDSNTKSFTIPLSCNPGTRVNLQIDGSAQNATNGVLNLNSGNDTATGVGIQLLYNDQPLQLGTSFLAGTTSTSGGYNIGLKSRYYQTNSDITTGTANSAATFTLTYR